LPEDCEIGELYVGGYDQPFNTIKVNKTLRALNGRIIECKWEENQWKFMRERTDKSYPNAARTAVSVCNSIKYPVTEAMLFSITDSMTDETQNQMMAPPSTTKVYK
jgi:mRNA-capping enzyme